MALDFPTSPSVGQTYAGPGGIVWQWDGTKWVNGAGLAAYAPIVSPAFSGNPTSVTPPQGDADTSIATTAFVQTAVAPYANDIGRNKLHNPLFNVAQRGAGPFTVAGNTLDRWKATIGLDAVSFTQQSLADGDRTAIGDEEARVCLQNGFTGNAGAAAFSTIAQAVESIRRLAGRTVIVSFWAKAAAGTPKLGINIYQNFGTGGSPSAGAYVLATGLAVTIGTTWARYSVSVPVTSAAGKTLGTNNDDSNNLVIWYSSGATNNALSGNVGVQSGTVSLWGVQFEIAQSGQTLPTILEKPDPRYDQSNCQRFYKAYNGVLLPGYGAAGGTILFDYLFEGMRVTPTAGISNTVYTNSSGMAVNAVVFNHLRLSMTATALGLAFASFDLSLSADL